MNEEIAYSQLFAYINSIVSISTEDFHTIKKYFHLKKYNRKEFLLEEGSECTIQGFIVSGTFRVYYKDHKASEHVLYFGFKDWWVGDIASFLSQSRSQIYVQAMEESFALVFSKEELEKVFSEVPLMERLFRIITQKTLAVLQKRFFLTVSANVEDRYNELLGRHPKIEQLVPQHQIASYLGILPESLSRMKKQLITRQKKDK